MRGDTSNIIRNITVGIYEKPGVFLLLNRCLSSVFVICVTENMQHLAWVSEGLGAEAFVDTCSFHKIYKTEREACLCRKKLIFGGQREYKEMVEHTKCLPLVQGNKIQD